jgi:predicted nucleic acid-binding protein
MMKDVFVDTSALVALANKGDAFHQITIARFDEFKNTNRHFIITHGIILEMANTFSRREYKGIALQMIEMIKQSACKTNSGYTEHRAKLTLVL